MTPDLPTLARDFLQGAEAYKARNPDFDCIEWRIARAYLAEYDRAEGLQSDMFGLLAGLFAALGIESASAVEVVGRVSALVVDHDRLRARVAELESVAEVEWRDAESCTGAMVRAHVLAHPAGPRSDYGVWMYEDEFGPGFACLGVDDDGTVWVDLTGHIQPHRWHDRYRVRPCAPDGTPVPWPVHDTAAPEVDADATVTDGPSGDCEGVTDAS